MRVRIIPVLFMLLLFAAPLIAQPDPSETDVDAQLQLLKSDKMVDKLLDNRGIDMPATRGNVTFKRAERVKNVEEHPELPME